MDTFAEDAMQGESIGADSEGLFRRGCDQSHFPQASESLHEIDHLLHHLIGVNRPSTA